MKDEDVAWLNRMPEESLFEKLRGCCGSDTWCEAMLRCRPYSTVDELHRQADEAMDLLAEQDWQQAFDSHPQIGDLNSLRMKFSGNKDWSAAEQSGITSANEQILSELAQGNADYLEKFGFIFIICATGKTAAELLNALKMRLPLQRSAELANAAAEQRKITHLRIDKIESSRL
jgi:2-oxo-4-hydroxy-4-carboxy-5-ureidoimidazoline decarboxylase